MARRLLKRVGVMTLTVFVAEVLYAILRPSPDMESFDPSAEFGDPTLPTLRVAVVGDSSVHAPGVFGPGDIWISLVCIRLAARGRHVVMKSFAVGGSKARDVIIGQLDDAIAFDPDIAFVSVGANDTLRGVSRGRFAVELDEIIGRMVETGAVVVQSGVGVMGTIPRLYPPLSTTMTLRSARFDMIHREVAARHGTHVIDQRSDEPAIWYRDRSLWAADHFHVSRAGHARWAETTWRTLEKILDDGKV